MAAVARRPQTNGVRNGERREQEEEEPQDHSLDDIDAAILQAFIARRVISLEDAMRVLNRIAEAADVEFRADQDAFEEAIARINKGIHDFDLEIRKTLAQKDGVPIWALVNTTSDPLAELATMHSPSEIAYFRALVAAICTSTNDLHEEVYAIKTTDAINLSSDNGVGLTKTAGTVAIDSFIREQWLEKSSKGFISLSERSLLELQAYLLDTFNDVEGDDVEGGTRTQNLHLCHACREIVTRGQRCGSLRCPVRFHKHCAVTFFSPRNSVCPTCKSPWKDHLPVGEEAMSDKVRRRLSNRQEAADDTPSQDGQEESAPASRNESPIARRRGTRQSTGTEDETGSRRGSRRTSARRSIRVDEDEMDEEEDLYG